MILQVIKKKILETTFQLANDMANKKVFGLLF